MSLPISAWSEWKRNLAISTGCLRGRILHLRSNRARIESLELSIPALQAELAQLKASTPPLVSTLPALMRYHVQEFVLKTAPAKPVGRASSHKSSAHGTSRSVNSDRIL